MSGFLRHTEWVCDYRTLRLSSYKRIASFKPKIQAPNLMSGYQYDPSGNSQTPQEYLWYSTLTEAYPIQDNNNGGDPLDINPQPAQTHPSPGYYYPPGPFEGLPMNYYHQDPVGNAMFQIPESSQSWMQYTQQTPSDGSSYGYAINPAFNNQMVPSPTPNFPSNPAYSNPLQQYPVESPRVSNPFDLNIELT